MEVLLDKSRLHRTWYGYLTFVAQREVMDRFWAKRQSSCGNLSLQLRERSVFAQPEITKRKISNKTYRSVSTLFWYIYHIVKPETKIYMHKVLHTKVWIPSHVTWLLAKIGFYARIRSVPLNALTLAGNSEISVPATRRRRGAGQILPGEMFAVWDLLSGRWSISRCGPAPGLIYSIEAVSSLGHRLHEWLCSKNGHWSFLCLVSLIIFALKTVDGAAVWDKFGTQIL